MPTPPKNNTVVSIIIKNTQNYKKVSVDLISCDTIINGMSEILNETAKIKAATSHYSSGFDSCRTIWENADVPHCSYETARKICMHLAHTDPTYIRQVIEATGSFKTFYARSGA
jgi:hypothetical protein